MFLLQTAQQTLGPFFWVVQTSSPSELKEKDVPVQHGDLDWPLFEAAAEEEEDETLTVSPNTIHVAKTAPPATKTTNKAIRVSLPMPQKNVPCRLAFLFRINSSGDPYGADKFCLWLARFFDEGDVLSSVVVAAPSIKSSISFVCTD